MLVRLMMFAVLLLLAPAHALAQQEDADALIERGIDLRIEHRDVEALELFERSQAQRPSARATAQIGLAEHALRHYVRAREKLAQALAASSDVWVRSRASVLLEALADAEAHLGRVEVIGCAAGIEVWIAAQQRAVCPLHEVIFVEPGDHEISFRRATGESVQAMLHASAAETATVTALDPAVSNDVMLLRSSRTEVLYLGESAAPIEASDAPANASSSNDADAQAWRVPVGWSAIGVGAAFAATGGVFHVLREQDAHYFNDHCLDENVANRASDCDARRERGEGERTGWAIGGYVAGGALIAAGTVLLLLSHDDRHAQTAWGCAPSLGTVLGFSCAGTF